MLARCEVSHLNLREEEDNKAKLFGLVYLRATALSREKHAECV
jgi:hypothetical protein